MNKVAAATGLATVLVLAGAYIGLPHAGIHVDSTQLVAAAAILALGYSIAGFSVLVWHKPAAGRAYASTPLNEDPVSHFIAPFKSPDAMYILARPNIPVDVMLMRYGSVFRDPSAHGERKVVLTIKKAKKDVFNPVMLRALFETLKPFDKSEHVLLTNEHDEFVGYIPWGRAVKEFTGENAEGKIRKLVIDVFDDPSKSKELRKLDGMSVDDIISDAATIHDAAKLTWFDDPIHGLVVYSGKRNRKPVGVINKNGLLQLLATGA